MKIVLAGCTGFIGTRLIHELLEADHTLYVLTRRPEDVKAAWQGRLETALWDARTLADWQRVVDGVDGVVNLTGEGIAAKRWTAKQKLKILNSRVESTHALVQAMRQATRKPAVLVNASAVGYYPDSDQARMDENTAAGDTFLSSACAAWEQAACTAEALGVRVVRLRIGVVLGPGGGALQKLVPAFKAFVGGPLGSGRQWFPWVHRDDVVGAAQYALHNEKLSGAVNVTAPNPVRMGEFCKVLGQVMQRPSWAPVPGFMLRIIVGEMADMLLGGQRAVPQQLSTHGYRFRYPVLEDALRQIL